MQKSKFFFKLFLSCYDHDIIIFLPKAPGCIHAVKAIFVIIPDQYNWHFAYLVSVEILSVSIKEPEEEK